MFVVFPAAPSSILAAFPLQDSRHLLWYIDRHFTLLYIPIPVQTFNVDNVLIIILDLCIMHMTLGRQIYLWYASIVLTYLRTS